jgi:hypothetical protein
MRTMPSIPTTPGSRAMTPPMTGRPQPTLTTPRATPPVTISPSTRSSGCCRTRTAPLRTMTLAQDPPRSAMVLESEEGEFRVISDGDETTSCMQMGGEWQCFTQTLDGEFAEGLFDLPGIEDTDPEDVADDETPDRIGSTRILDRDAVCLWFDESEGAFDVRVCFDTETGIVLMSTGTSSDGEEFRLEAVEVGDVDPALFDLPADPMDFDLGELGDMGDFDFDDFDPDEMPDFGN